MGVWGAYMPGKTIVIKISYIWRIFGTFLGFLFFGVGAFFLCITIFKIIDLFHKDKINKCKQIRLIIQYVFRLYLTFLNVIGVLIVKTTDLDTLKKMKGTLVISNHPSLLDVVVIMAYLKNVQCIVKKELWLHPILGGVMRAAGFISNDVEPNIFLSECKKHLAKGEKIIIFP